MKVLYTVDTELSLMMQLHGASPAANYKSAILGETAAGAFGVPYQMDVLGRYGLKGVFFVEALHTQTIGDEMLRRTVDLIQSRGHEVQLHCHVEWLWFHEGGLKLPREKQSLADLDFARQLDLLGMAKTALERAGAPAPTAFRAGNYGANDDTLRALAALGILYDSSFNRTDPKSRIELSADQIAPIRREGVIEVPVSWFFAPPGGARHAQLCAVSAAEFRHAVKAAAAARHPFFNIVSHSFELLSRDRSRPQNLVVRRFERLCRALAEGAYATAGFNDMDGELSAGAAPRPIGSNHLRTGLRMAEQAIGNFIYER